MDAAHKIVLCRNDRCRLLLRCHSPLPDISHKYVEMSLDDLLRYVLKGDEFMVDTLFFHLLADRFRHDIARKQFVDEPLSLVIQENRALASGGL